MHRELQAAKRARTLKTLHRARSVLNLVTRDAKVSKE